MIFCIHFFNILKYQIFKADLSDLRVIQLCTAFAHEPHEAEKIFQNHLQNNQEKRIFVEDFQCQQDVFERECHLKRLFKG